MSVSLYMPMFIYLYARPPRGWEVGSRGCVIQSCGVQGVGLLWGRSSGVGERVGGMGIGWRWRRECPIDGGAKPFG